ncbi:MAG: GntR family transcriptional regulator, partial [Alphaproteobacteria bacterium]
MKSWHPLSKTVAKRIEDLVASNDDGTRPRLPSQRELSSIFGVSRTSVREALTLLEASGKLRTEPGRGSFWVDPAEAGQPAPVDPDDARERPRDKTYPKSEISRFRYLIEGQSGRLAAMRITDAQIRRLEDNLTAFKSQIRSLDLEA